MKITIIKGPILFSVLRYFNLNYILNVNSVSLEEAEEM